MSLFGGKGESGSDRLAKAQEKHAAVHRAGAGLFQGGVRKAAGEAAGTGGVPSVFLPTAAQAKRSAAGVDAGSGRSLSILPRSEAQTRRETVAKIRAQEEAAGIVRRAAETKAKAEVEARAAEQTKKAAEALQVRRAAFEQATRRVLVVKANIPKAALSATARAVFGYLAVRYADNGSRPVVLAAADVAFALSIKEVAARDALDGLQRLGWVVEVTDSFGAKKLMPAAHAAATIEQEAA